MSEVFRLRIASAEDIRQFTFAEISSPDILDPRTRRPASRGVLSEAYLGRENEWECACGRLRGEKNVGYVCVRCDQPVRHLRSTRFGRIELATTVVHPLFKRPLALLLNYTEEAFRQIVHYQCSVVVESHDTPLRVGQLIPLEEEYHVRNQYGDRLTLAMGGDACWRLLETINVMQLRQKLRATARSRFARDRLDVVETICAADPDDPDGYAARLLLDCLPIVPAEQRRPREQGGNAMTADVNDIYASTINRNNRLHKLIEVNAPPVIIFNERRLLQQIVDTLFDSASVRNSVRGERGRRIRSLADRLRGPRTKNLLNKRSDYSATTVVVPDESLAVDQCTLPECIAVELFRPFLLIRLAEDTDADLAQRACQLLDILRPRIQPRIDEAFRAGLRLYRELLAEIAPGHRLLLEQVMRGRRLLVVGRTPHIPALTPVLTQSRAVGVHPHLASTLGVRFRGECVRLHLPLSREAQEEADRLLFPRTEPQPAIAADADASRRRRQRPDQLFRAARAARHARIRWLFGDGQVGEPTSQGWLSALLAEEPLDVLACAALAGAEEESTGPPINAMRGVNERASDGQANS